MVGPAPLPGEFEQLMRDLYPRLTAGLAAACGDVELARDIAQDAFLKAFEQWDRLRHHENPAAWVQLVARNKLIDNRRRQANFGRKRHLVGDDNVTVDDAPEVDVRAAVERLPPDQRMALVAYYFDDLSVSEIATLCGVPQGTVKWRLSAGRAGLRTSPELAHE